MSMVVSRFGVVVVACSRTLEEQQLRCVTIRVFFCGRSSGYSSPISVLWWCLSLDRIPLAWDPVRRYGGAPTSIKVPSSRRRALTSVKGIALWRTVARTRTVMLRVG